MQISISKKYNDVVVFSNFNLAISLNKINVILGPSGCGKTTLLQIIAGLTSYDGVIDLPDKLSYVFQEDRLFPYLTIEKNLTIINNDREKLNYYLAKFSVNDLTQKYPHQLSGGERQRIAIIRALNYESKFVLMDEPFKSLDFDLKLSLVKEVLALQQELQTTMILVTHDLDVAILLGEVIHVLSQKPTKLLLTINNENYGTINNPILREKLLTLLTSNKNASS